MTSPKAAYGASRCDCCDLSAESCGRAVEVRQMRERAQIRDALRARGWFPAQYPGACEGCGERFEVGDLININPASGWRSECCA